MTTPRGTEIYNLDNKYVTSRGVCYTIDELNRCLKGQVSKILFDQEGMLIIENMLSNTSATGFKNENVKRILSKKLNPEKWRVGEALAESYLGAHKNCSFPWNSDRDKKNENSSLTGADIVGFQKTTGMDNRFAFGEVKTLEEKKYPPSRAQSLKSQLTNLYTNTNTRDNLVKYLAHRATNSPWQQQFKNSFRRYMKNNSDVSLFGFMVRDVAPDERDLSSITHSLSEISAPQPSLELTALYLPAGSISSFSSQVMAAAKEGDL
ncbi:MAG: hypothetical protein NT166_31410 [Candidatus Aminicenantes bacterium]|nr:hypothetical protein [Candidatus Aminicenantes bacterium]